MVPYVYKLYSYIYIFILFHKTNKKMCWGLAYGFTTALKQLL